MGGPSSSEREDHGFSFLPLLVCSTFIRGWREREREGGRERRQLEGFQRGGITAEGGASAESSSLVAEDINPGLSAAKRR